MHPLYNNGNNILLLHDTCMSVCDACVCTYGSAFWFDYPLPFGPDKSNIVVVFLGSSVVPPVGFRKSPFDGQETLSELNSPNDTRPVYGIHVVRDVVLEITRCSFFSLDFLDRNERFWIQNAEQGRDGIVLFFFFWTVYQ